MTAAVDASQRYTASRRCQICHGADGDARRQGKRCNGYVSSDGTHARCSREEYAGPLPIEDSTGTYVHRLSGPCDCGEQHGEQPRESRGKGSIVASYDYHDEMGAVQYRVNRHITPNGEKTFSQCRPDGAGGLISGTAGVRQVPFRLPELLAADPANLVFVVEGEKCALALHKLGLIATTARGGTGGVKQWESPEFCAPFKGRQVVTLPDVDADGKGRRYAERVVAAVAPVAASVKIVDLPGLQPTGEDVVEWIERGGTAEKLLELAADIGPCPAAPEPKSATAIHIPTAVEVVLAETDPLPPPISTGIDGLDALLAGGIYVESVYSVPGPTGRGKCALAAGFARHISGIVPLIYLSTELRARQLVARVVAPIIGRPWLDLWRGMHADQRSILAALGDRRLHIVDPVRQRGLSLREIADSVAQQHGVAPVYLIDYLQQLARRMAPLEDRRYTVSALSEEILTWALDAKSAAIVVSSTARVWGDSRADEGRQTRDYAHSAKESGDVEQDAAGVIWVDIEQPDPNQAATPATIRVAKGRYAMPGELQLEYVGALGLFRVPTAGAARAPSRAEREIAAMMERGREILRRGPVHGKSALVDAIGGNAAKGRLAADKLSEGGEVVIEPGPRNSRIWRLSSVSSESRPSLVQTTVSGVSSVSSVPLRGDETRLHGGAKRRASVAVLPEVAASLSVRSGVFGARRREKDRRRIADVING